VRPAIDITTEGGELVQRARLKSDLWLLSSASSVLTFRREWSCVRASLRHATTNTHVTRHALIRRGLKSALRLRTRAWRRTFSFSVLGSCRSVQHRPAHQNTRSLAPNEVLTPAREQRDKVSILIHTKIKIQIIIWIW